MNKREYERLMEIYGRFVEVPEYKGFMETVGLKEVNLGTGTKKVSEIIEEIVAAGSYDNLSDDIKNASSKTTNEINIFASNMEDISNIVLGVGELEMEDPNEDFWAMDDKVYLSRMRKLLKKEKSFWHNSDQFIAVEEEVARCEKLAEELVDAQDNPEKRAKYMESLEKISNLVDKYMEHKAIDGAKENSYGKIGLCKQIQGYVNERKSILYAEELDKASAEIHKNKMKLANASEMDQLADWKTKECQDTYERIVKLYEKETGKPAEDKFASILDNADSALYGVLINDDSYYSKEKMGSVLLLSYLRNELYNGGNTVTPFIKEVFENPEAVKKAFEINGAVDSVDFNVKEHDNVAKEENLKTFLKGDCKANVIYAQSKSMMLANEKLLSTTISTNGYVIEQERIKRQQEKEEAERIEKANIARLEEEEKQRKFREEREEKLRGADVYESLIKYAPAKAEEFSQIAKQLREEVAEMDKKERENSIGKTSKVSDKSKENKGVGLK